MRRSPVRPRDGRTGDGLHVALRPLDASAAPLIAAWRRLGRDALVDNLFFEADFALAAADAFGAGIGLLVVCDRPVEAPDMRVLALWPCRAVYRWGLPLPVLMGWTHGFSIFGAPLIDRGEAARALRALLEAPALLGLPRRLLMPYLPLDGPFAALLDRVLADSGVERGGRRADFWEHERGYLDLGCAGAHELAVRPSPSKQRQLARFARRLAAKGRVEFESVRAPRALADALDDYIALEAAGWKGRAGTAIERRPAEVVFMRRLVQAYGAGGGVRIDRLRRDGRSLAASLAIETGATLWYLKISHDEAEARNSPGAQLVARVTRSLLADPRITAADSCAPPDFPLIETIWTGRRRLAHGLIEAARRDPMFPLAVRLEGLRARVSRARAARGSGS